MQQGWRASVFLGLLAACGAANGAEPLQAETYFTEKLGPSTPHWVVVNDLNFIGYMDSKIYVFDGDSGAMLGMLSAGGWRGAVELAPDFSEIYSPETYYERGTRGTRTDVVAVYDTTNLEVLDEIVIPAKRATGMPMRAYSGLSDDGRFVYVSNMTPATSTSVIDVKARKFIAEIDTPGCTLVYPTGARSFAQLCADGTLQHVGLTASGELAGRDRTKAFFDADDDPVTEKAARHRDSWLFVSFNGWVHPVDFSSGTPVPGEQWSLFTDAERADSWRPGGLQFTAVHDGLGLFYVAVHQGGDGSHKQAGSEVWVYDLTTRKKRAAIVLDAPASSIAVSNDDKPLLYTSDLAAPVVYVYDAVSGQQQRAISGMMFTPSLIQTPLVSRQ
jgi:methylamine dehydrogenase heavy chain